MEIISYRDYGVVNPLIIVDFSSRFGVDFPTSYIDLLSKYNAIRPLKEYFDFKEVDGKTGISDISFYGYGYEKINVYDQEDLLRFQNSIKETDSIERNQPDEYSYESVIVFGHTASGDYIAFDYRQNPETDNPPIVMMYHDQFVKDENGNSKMLVIKVADSFDDFLNLLHE